MEKTVTLSTFQKDIERLGKEGMRAAAVDLQREMQGEFRDEVLRRAPVGSRAKKRKGGMVAAGEFRRSIVSVPGPDAIQPGQPSYVATSAPQANVLERGRKVGRSVKALKGRRGGRRRPEGQPRMMGSIQAPQGVFGPSVDVLDRKRESIMDAVIERAEAKL